MPIEKQSEEARKAERELMTVKLTLAVDNIRKESSFQESIKVFGFDGVGGITSDRVCVRVDGTKATVWLSEGLYSALSEKVSKEFKRMEDELRKPDEKILGDYTPIFKALSNCGITIKEVNSSSSEKLSEVRQSLEEQHEVIRSSKVFNKAFVIKQFGPVVVSEALERYEKNRIPPSEVEKQPPFRMQMEWVLFEKEIAQQLSEMNEYGVFKVLTAPDGKRVNIHGNKGIGVIAAPFLAVQLDRNEAKVFLEDSFKLQISGKTLEEIRKNPKLLGEELRILPHILNALSDFRIQVTELNLRTANEVKEIAAKLVEQNWVASQLLKAPEEVREKVVEQLLDSVKSLKKVEEAVARYGIEISVEKRRKAYEPSEKLSKKISEKLRLLEWGMVDEKVDGVEIVGMAGFFAIKVKDDAVIKVRGNKASVLLSKDFSSILNEHVKSKKEFEALQRTQFIFYPGIDQLSFKHPQLLEGNKKLLPYLSAIEALKEHGVESASFKTVSHNADYYMEKTRREFDIPFQFSRKLKEGRSFGEVVDEMLTILPATELAAKLDNAGMQKEAERVAVYVDSVRSTKREVRRMLEEWVEKGVPSKQEMIERMNQEVLEGMLRELVAEFTESNEKLSRRIIGWREKLNQPSYFGSASQERLTEFIREDTDTVELNKKRIEKAQEALKALEGKDEP